MQTIIYAFCTKGKSLRDQIEKDDRLAEEPYGFSVRRQQKPGRSPGWAVVELPRGVAGVMNVEWDADTSLLKCRVITRKEIPHEFVGRFVDYLLKHYPKRIRNITIVPPRG